MRDTPAHRSGGAVRVWRRTLAASVSVVASVMLSSTIVDNARAVVMSGTSPVGEAVLPSSSADQGLALVATATMS